MFFLLALFSLWRVEAWHLVEKIDMRNVQTEQLGPMVQVFLHRLSTMCVFCCGYSFCLSLFIVVLVLSVFLFLNLFGPYGPMDLRAHQGPWAR